VRGGASAGGRVSRPHVAERFCPRLAENGGREREKRGTIF
jgi:hypothetical protein